MAVEQYMAYGPPDEDDAMITIIQDRFGKTYHVFPSEKIVGEIACTVLDSADVKPTDQVTSKIKCRIMAKVHHNTVRAMHRRSPWAGSLESGYWYEIVSD